MGRSSQSPHTVSNGLLMCFSENDRQQMTDMAAAAIRSKQGVVPEDASGPGLTSFSTANNIRKTLLKKKAIFENSRTYGR
jgi:hypothetical protein